MNKKILISLFVAVASLLATTEVKAVDVKGYDLEILLDSSGSMAENLGGKSKMTIAKEAIQSVVGEIPDGSYVGFRAYGHQSGVAAKNCTDTQAIVPMGAINKSDFMSKVNALTPRGWTPIDYSLRQAQNDFPASTEYQKMIILVSDGEETCGGDPCQAVKDLKAAGFTPIVNTVGFSVGAVAREQLKCIAAATGGEYKDASNASELTESMRVFSKRAFQSYTTSGTTEAGTGFNNAPLVTPGIYGGDILTEETKFYKVNLKNGQAVTASVSVKREKSIDGGIIGTTCTKFVPSIKLYDTDLMVVAEDKGVWHTYDKKLIEGMDVSPHSYKVNSAVTKSGDYYVAISNEWDKECSCEPNCNFGSIGIDTQKANSNKLKFNKAFYDMKITVEGAGEAESVASTSKKVTNSSAAADLDDVDTQTDDDVLADDFSSASGDNTTRNIIIGVIVLIFLGGIGAVVFFVMKNSGKGNIPESITFSEKAPQNNSTPVAPRANPFAAPVAPIASAISAASTSQAIPPVSILGVKFCTKCGTKNSPDKAFCINCGGKL